MNNELGINCIRETKLRNIDINDSFFDSLKIGYPEFEKSYQKNIDSECFVQLNEVGEIKSFISLVTENFNEIDFTPSLKKEKYVEITSFKVDPSKKSSSENFIDLAIHYALSKKIYNLYLVIHDKYDKSIEVLSQFGFAKYAKDNKTGDSVYVKELKHQRDNPSLYYNFPYVKVWDSSFFVLGILPRHHSNMFPKYKLRDENNMLTATSVSNGVTKIYLAGMKEVDSIKHGDLIFIYRTSGGKQSKYNAVVTSVCIAEEYRRILSFKNYEEFATYCQPYATFTEAELLEFYESKKYPHVIKMLYINDLPKKVSREELLKNGIFNDSKYSGFASLTKSKARKLLSLAEYDDKNIIID